MTTIATPLESVTSVADFRFPAKIDVHLRSLERCDDLPLWKVLQSVSGCHTSLAGILGEA